MSEQEQFEGWAIVELMGHRQTAGKIATVTIASVEMLRVDTPGPDGRTIATQYYGGSAVYCLTPCDEATAFRALRETYSLPPPVRLALDQAEQRAQPALPLAVDEEAEDDDAAVMAMYEGVGHG